MKYLLLLCLSLASALAQNLETITHDDDHCSCKAEFDTSRFSKEEIQNALNLSTWMEELEESLKPTRDLPFPAKKERYEKALADAKEKIQSHMLPKEKIWDEIRKFYLRDISLNGYLELAEINYFHDQNKDHLKKDFEGSPLNAECKTIADAAKSARDVKHLWHNCANRQWRGKPRVPESYSQEVEALKKKIGMKCKCDEP